MTVVDQKHRLGFLITRELVARNMLSPDRTINSTGFFKKGPAASDAERIALLSIPCYRQLVFARLEYTGDRSASPLKSWIAENVPFSRPLYRKVKALSRGQWRRQPGRRGAGAGE